MVYLELCIPSSMYVCFKVTLIALSSKSEEDMRLLTWLLSDAMRDKIFKNAMKIEGPKL